MSFGPEFLWGSATAAFQIEGSIAADGRSESIWDRFCKKPGAIADGSDGSRACDHYNLWKRDIELMKWLGLKAYRFSIAWPRILPGGRGKVNARGLDFYDRLVDGLLAAGIRPFATLYHWDLPQVLEAAGGWPARDTAKAFVDYVAVVTERLGDRVKYWMTHNEPYCAAMFGYRDGVQAPGLKDPAAALAAAHHLLLSHGFAVRVIRNQVPGAQVGIVLNLSPVVAASSSDADRDASRERDGDANRWYLDPLYGRGYPMDVVQDLTAAGALRGNSMTFVETGDMATIAEPTDFLGINYYVRSIARSKRVSEKDNAPVSIAPNTERTAMGWEVYPQGLTDILLQVHERYSPPAIYVAENGAAFDDPPPDPENRVADTPRRKFLVEHLAAAERAIQAGVPLRGYFQWSLLDNFEWSHGYRKRFGLFYVDYETQRRIPKDSAFWYKQAIASGKLPEGAQ